MLGCTLISLDASIEGNIVCNLELILAPFVDFASTIKFHIKIIMDLEDDLLSPLSLISKEGKSVSIPLTACQLSEYIKNVIGSDSTTSQIECSYVQFESLTRIVEWLVHCSQVDGKATEPPKPIPRNTDDISQIFDEWETEFFRKIPDDATFDILMSANYLGIDLLVNQCAAKLAVTFIKKDVKEVCDAFEESFESKDQTKIRSRLSKFLFSK